MAWPHRFALRSYLPWWWAPPRMPWFGQPFGHLWTTIQGCREWHPIVKVRHLIDQVLPSHPEKLNTLKHYITTCPVDNSIFQTMSGASPYLLQTRLCLSLILLNCYMAIVSTCHHMSPPISRCFSQHATLRFQLANNQVIGHHEAMTPEESLTKRSITSHCTSLQYHIYRYTYHISYMHIYIYAYNISYIHNFTYTHTYTHTLIYNIYIYISYPYIHNILSI